MPYFDHIDIPRFPLPEATPEPVYHCAECGELIPEDDLPGPWEMPLVVRCRECEAIQEEGDEEEMTIGELVDALRQKCMEDLGVNVCVRVAAYDVPNHEKAEEIATRMTQELNGWMSGIGRPLLKPDSPDRWYHVGTNMDEMEFVAYWEAKEKPPVQAAV